MASSASTQTPYADLPSSQVASIRQDIRSNLAAGYDMSAIDHAIQQKYGVTAKQVLEPNPSDFGRSVAQGVTLGHADEIAGLYAKLTGKSYQQARDAVRTNDAEFQKIHPWLKFFTEAAGAGIPGLAAAPLAGIQKGATAMNIVRGAVAGGGMGAVAGEGNSNAPTTGGVVRDAAFGAGGGALAGGVLSGVASKLATTGNPLSSAQPVAKEIASQLPSEVRPATPTVEMMLRQERLAPGTNVLADMSPEVRSFVKGVGADRETAMAAKDAGQVRVNRLLAAKRGVGQTYNQLNDVQAPADETIRSVLDAAGRRDLIQNGQVDLGDLHQLRSALLKAGGRANAGMKGTELKSTANAITDWMQSPDGGNVPWLRQTDADFAFLGDRSKAALQTQQLVIKSLQDFGLNRAFGKEPASIGGSISVPSQVGTTIVRVGKKLVPSLNPANRAKAVASLLLDPERTPERLQSLALLHDALLQAQSAPLASNAGNAVAGFGIQGLKSLTGPPQQQQP